MIGFIYAIGDETGRVKIGWSQQPVRRLTKIGSDCSSVVTLLGVVPASRLQEREIHTLLSPWRVNREWFRHEGPVAVFVSMLGKLKPQLVSDGEQVHPLRAYRVANALTLEQFALAFGVNKTTVFRWEEGQRQVPAERVLAISKETGIAPHILRPDIYPHFPKGEEMNPLLV